MDYFSSLMTGMSNFEQRKIDIQGIYDEIDLFSKSLIEFTEEKFGCKIRIQREFIDDPNLTSIQLFAKQASSSLAGFFKDDRKPYLCLVNELNNKKPLVPFYFSKDGYPVQSKIYDDEWNINNRSELGEFFKALAAPFTFYETLEKFVNKTKEDYQKNRTQKVIVPMVEKRIPTEEKATLEEKKEE